MRYEYLNAAHDRIIIIIIKKRRRRKERKEKKKKQMTSKNDVPMCFKGRENSRAPIRPRTHFLAFARALLKLKQNQSRAFKTLWPSFRRSEARDKAKVSLVLQMYSKWDRSIRCFGGKRRMDDFRIFVSEHFFRTIFLFLESHRSSKHLFHDVNKLNRYSFIFFVYRSWIFIISTVLFSNLFSFQVYINHPLESFPIKSYHRLEKLRPYRRTTRKTRWIRVIIS